jgi:hypothetical protein
VAGGAKVRIGAVPERKRPQHDAGALWGGLRLPRFIRRTSLPTWSKKFLSEDKFHASVRLPPLVVY